MTSSNNPEQRSALGIQLRNASAQAERGEYAAALKEIREVRTVEPRNIYVLAFERQMEQLIELTETGLITDEQRVDILESIPGIVDLAIAVPNAGPAEVGVLDKKPAAPSPQEHTAALTWLKDQYFQHAHDYVEKGQYAHALAELRRVYIIDPENAIAHDFEQQVQRLQDLSSQKEASADKNGPEAESVDAGQKKESNMWIYVTALAFIAVAALVVYFITR